MPEVSIIIPARNEGASIKAVVERIIDESEIDCQILIVNDHSTDMTRGTADSLAARFKNVKVIDNNNPAGFVNAFLCGLKAVDSPFFVMMMSDLCDDPKTINKMYEKIKEGYDIVVGSRYIPGGARLGGSKFKGFFSSFMGKTLCFLIGIPTHDIPNAFKMYRMSVLNGIKVSASAFEVSAEIPLKAYFRGAKIAEVPTVWKERRAGKSHFKILKVAPGYIRLYLWAIMKRMVF